MGQSASVDDTGSCQQLCDEIEIAKESLNFLIMGNTGDGKSSVGNSILGCKLFEFSACTQSKTQEISSGSSEFGNYLLNVVDGPGLHDTRLNNDTEDTERAIENMSKAMAMSSEGVDAFLFVFKFSTRFTQADVSALATLRGIFGKDYFKHVIVVLTGGDMFPYMMIQENFKGTFADWCEKQTGPFRELYKACQGRCVLFDNVTKDEETQTAQRDQLAKLADHLKFRNGRYTADCFKLAEVERQKLIITLKEPILKKEIQQMTGVIITNIKTYSEQPSPAKKKEIQKAIQKLKRQVKTEDMGHGLLNHVMKTVLEVEQNLHDVNKLRALTRHLENTRKAGKIWPYVSKAISITGAVLFQVLKGKLACIGIVGMAASIAGDLVMTGTEVYLMNEKQKIDSKMQQ